MGTAYTPDYWWFEEYQEDVLEPLTRTEELVLLDEEIVNMTLLSRYQNRLDPNEWSDLEAHYSRLFADFIIGRVEGMTDTSPVQEHKQSFDDFRHHVIELNDTLSRSQTRSVTTISKPAERILLKQLRRQQYDPSALDVSYIDRGGGLYLLELFVTAAQQEARTDNPLLSTLIDEALQLGGLSKEQARDLLSYPVLMVSLWDNQETGLEKWLRNDKQGILEMATATGKTVAGIAAIAYLCGDLPGRDDQTPTTESANVMIVAHSNAILSQWEEEIADKLGLATSALSGSGRPDTLRFATGTVEFYTAQSLLPRYDRDLRNEYDLVIYDEVHHYSNVDGFGEAIQRPNYKAAMGLSATIGEENDPKRRKLEELLTKVVYTYDVEDATPDGIIPDFEWTVHPTALDPSERTEWEETTESITNQFRYLKHDDETKQIVRQLSVPFAQLDDLGDFIQAHQAVELELDRDLPDSWSQLQASIQSRNWIRHRSQPKLDGALDLTEQYLTEVDRGVKIVMFAMDIDTTERIGEALNEVTDNVYVVHSKIASSTRKKDRLIRQRIDRFAEADHGVLIAPKLLDEGIDVPDAEVGINVAGTKTKLQLVQRMGRVLRKHGDQSPHFHHFVAVPDEHHLEGLDGKQYVQELNWVRELGEAIGEQPTIEDAHVDPDVIERAEERGNELWAQDLLADIEVETVQGTVHLDELVEDLTLSAAETLHETVDFDADALAKTDWQSAMQRLREDETLTVDTLQRIWWFFPLYRERPAELDELLGAIIDEKSGEASGPDSPGHPPSLDSDGSEGAESPQPSLRPESGRRTDSGSPGSDEAPPVAGGSNSSDAPPTAQTEASVSGVKQEHGSSQEDESGTPSQGSAAHAEEGSSTDNQAHNAESNQESSTAAEKEDESGLFDRVRSLLG